MYTPNYHAKQLEKILSEYDFPSFICERCNGNVYVEDAFKSAIESLKKGLVDKHKKGK